MQESNKYEDEELEMEIEICQQNAELDLKFNMAMAKTTAADDSVHDMVVCYLEFDKLKYSWCKHLQGHKCVMYEWFFN